ncbi:MAG TPA: SDR family oxidoreductase [Rhodanobacteraceae bacterium]|nr:SDR family oxidoreductase [Rhodanobacteraceae bacterium]
MKTLENQRALVTGGSSGLGLGIVEALVAAKANVVVVARDAQRLADVERRLCVTTVIGDVADAGLAESLLREFRPSLLALNAGAIPAMGSLHEQTWEGFSNTWNSDVKAGFHWLQAALRLPLARGSRVLVGSSGAAVNGSPMSGGYAGAKRMLWLMAGYANGVSVEQDLGIRFQAIVPRQMLAAGGVGRAGAQAYARRKGVTPEAFLANFGTPMSAREFGDHVVGILTDPQYETAPALALRGDSGVQVLDA